MADPTLDAKSSLSQVMGDSSVTFSHTCAGENGYLRVDVYCSDQAISSVTYNGVAATLKGGGTYTKEYGLVAPATGAHDVVVTFADKSMDAWVEVTSWNGVNQDTPTGTIAVNGIAEAASSSLSVSSEEGDLAVDFIHAIQPVTMTRGGGQTLLNQAAYNDIGSSYKSGAASSTSMSWDFNSESVYREHVGIALKGIGGSPATTTVGDITGQGEGDSGGSSM